MNQKKRDLEQWERDECAALKAAIAEWNRVRPKGERITQEQAGEALGMNQGSFSNYLNGRTALNFEFALKIKNLFGIPVEAYSTRLAAEIIEKYDIWAKKEDQRSDRLGTAITTARSLRLPNTQTSLIELNRFFESCEDDGFQKRRAAVREARNLAVHGNADEDRLTRIFKLFYVIASAEIDNNLTNTDLAITEYLLTTIDARYAQQEEKNNIDHANLGNRS